MWAKDKKENQIKCDNGRGTRETYVSLPSFGDDDKGPSFPPAGHSKVPSIPLPPSIPSVPVSHPQFEREEPIDVCLKKEERKLIRPILGGGG